MEALRMGVRTSLIGVSPLVQAWREQGSDWAPEWMDFIVAAVIIVVMASHKVRVCSSAEMGSCVARVTGSG